LCHTVTFYYCAALNGVSNKFSMATHINNSTNTKVNYGIDAPGVIRNNLVIGAISIGVAILLAEGKLSFLPIPPVCFITFGGYLMVTGLLMLRYSLYGKYKHRDRMLNMIKWTGDEHVLDVGTGKGLLMIGAAKQLTTGRSTGIDIWNKEDLTGNTEAYALNNALLEGVADKVQIENENATHMDFPDNAFDVILSNLCLHNIYNKEGRNQACEEIFRVLKPGGTAIISDFRHTKKYRDAFELLGMHTEKPVTWYFDTFPPLTIIKAVKPV
jgi:arsenite methyltransferase